MVAALHKLGTEMMSGQPKRSVYEASLKTT